MQYAEVFFNTIPISPRVFYQSASNDVVKSFDLVHARFLPDEQFEIWLGEAKLYEDRAQAVSAAVASITEHIGQGFLTNQKLLLGPQIPKSTPHYNKIVEIFESQTSLDKFLNTAVFVVGVLANGDAIQSAKTSDASYRTKTVAELQALAAQLSKSGLQAKVKLILIYVPLKNKETFSQEFDSRLKALQ